MLVEGCGSYEFGPFRLDPTERTLFGDGRVVGISPKAFDLLVVLVRKAGRVVDKEELMREVWPDTFVEENNLSVNISALRKALEEASSGQLYIQTVPKRGYRFAASVRRTEESPPLLEKASEAPRAPVRDSVPRPVDAESLAIVGRQQELDKLSGLLERSVNGAGQFVLITGEAGIGKTALARCFLQAGPKRFPGVLIGAGGCVEQYGTGEAYLPFLEALREILLGDGYERSVATLQRAAPTWCLQFPSIFSGATLGQLQREAIGANKERMLRELGDALDEITAATPVVLCLEDLHWADPSTIDLIQHLARRAKNHRLLLLGTARPEQDPLHLKNCKLELYTQSAIEEIILPSLGNEHVSQYLNDHFRPNGFPGELAETIYRKTEGHPLFVTGVFQLLREREDVVNRQGTWVLARPAAAMDLTVPASVRSMIEKKVGLLSDAERQALQYASIEGEVFTSTVVAALLEADELDLEERLDVLGKLHRLIHAEGEEELPNGSVATIYRFTHALYQNFLYDQLLSKRRVLLHRRAGETLERVYAGQHARVAGALATHFERGRNFVKAIAFLIQAGDTALSRYANAEAVSLFSRGLELADKLPEPHQAEPRAVLLQERALAQLALGRLKEAAEDYRAMSEACRAAGNLEGECRAWIGACYVAHQARDVQGMEQFNLQARALAERIGNQALMAEVDTGWGMCKNACGQLAEADAAFERGISIGRSLKHRPAMVVGLTYSGILHFWRSDYAKAERLQMEASQLAGEARDGFNLPLNLFFLGLTQANRGRISEAMGSMQQALDMAKRNNNAVVLSRIPNGIGWISREMGDLGAAIEFNEGCVEFSRRTKSAEAEANALLNLVYDYMLAGEPKKCEDSLERILPLYGVERWIRWRFYGIRHNAAQSEYWLTRRKLDRAEEHARALLANAQQNSVAKYVAVARRLLGEIAAVSGDATTAEEELTRSFEPFARHPMPLIEWRNHAALGRLLAARNRPRGAGEAFRRAETLVRELAGNISDPAQRKLFLEMDAVREVIAGASG